MDRLLDVIDRLCCCAGRLSLLALATFYAFGLWCLLAGGCRSDAAPLPFPRAKADPDAWLVAAPVRLDYHGTAYHARFGPDGSYHCWRPDDPLGPVWVGTWKGREVEEYLGGPASGGPPFRYTFTLTPGDPITVRRLP